MYPTWNSGRSFSSAQMESKDRSRITSSVRPSASFNSMPNIKTHTSPNSSPFASYKSSSNRKTVFPSINKNHIESPENERNGAETTKAYKSSPEPVLKTYLKKSTASTSKSLKGTTGAQYRSKYSSHLVFMLRDYWKEVDEDRDGKVTKQQFLTVYERKKRQNEFKGTSGLFSESFFDLLDRNNSNVITFKQLLSALFPNATVKEKRAMYELAFPTQKADTEEIPKLNEQQVKELSDIFAMFDTDNSGAVTIDELREATVHLKMTKADVDMIFGDIDKDGSGEISKEEFMTGMARNYIKKK